MSGRKSVKLKLSKKSQEKSSKNAKDLEGIDPKTYSRRWWILSALCVTLLGVMLANSSLNLALPAMAKDLSLSQLQLTWIVNIYTLLFASLLFVAGAIGDRYGRKIAMQIGLAIFISGTLCAGFVATTGTELIIARAIMGIGGAFVMPTTLSILNNTFPRKERPRAVAIWSAIAGVGMMFGSIISGILLEHFSWNSLFLFSAIVGMIALATNQYLAHESHDEAETPVDWLGGLLSMATIFGIVYGVTEIPGKGISDTAVLASLIGGGIALILFVLWELRTKNPMLDMKLFKNRNFAVSSLVLTLTFLAMSGVLYSLSQLMQLVVGYSALESSLRMIPLMLPMLFVGPIVPAIVKKFGARVVISVGLIFTSIGFFMMSFWMKDLTYFQMFCTMLVMILGIALAMTPGTNILMSSVPRNRSGMGSAMNDTTRQLGASLGVAILGAILSSTYANQIHDTAIKFGDKIAEGLESSLAVAVEISSHLGVTAESVISAAKDAFMSGVNQAAIAGAIIIFVAAAIAFVGISKHSDKSDETI